MLYDTLKYLIGSHSDYHPLLVILTYHIKWHPASLHIGWIPFPSGLEVIRAGPVHKIAELDFGGPLHSLVLTLDCFSPKVSLPGKSRNCRKIQRKPTQTRYTLPWFWRFQPVGCWGHLRRRATWARTRVCWLLRVKEYAASVCDDLLQWIQQTWPSSEVLSAKVTCSSK